MRRLVHLQTLVLNGNPLLHAQLRWAPALPTGSGLAGSTPACLAVNTRHPAYPAHTHPRALPLA